MAAQERFAPNARVRVVLYGSQHYGRTGTVTVVTYMPDEDEYRYRVRLQGSGVVASFRSDSLAPA